MMMQHGTSLLQRDTVVAKDTRRTTWCPGVGSKRAPRRVSVLPSRELSTREGAGQRLAMTPPRGMFNSGSANVALNDSRIANLQMKIKALERENADMNDLLEQSNVNLEKLMMQQHQQQPKKDASIDQHELAKILDEKQQAIQRVSELQTYIFQLEENLRDEKHRLSLLEDEVAKNNLLLQQERANFITYKQDLAKEYEEHYESLKRYLIPSYLGFITRIPCIYYPRTSSLIP